MCFIFVCIIFVGKVTDMMEDVLANLHKNFPSLPQNSPMKVYKARIQQMRLMMIKGIPSDIRWIIKARV